MAQKTLQEKIDAALNHKNKGNEYFQKEEWTKALQEYHLALLYVKGLDGSGSGFASMAAGALNENASDGQKVTIKDILVAVRSNMAAALLKVGKPERAKAECDAVLQSVPNHQKALYRRGVALIALKEYEKAKADFEKLLKESPNDKNALNQLKIIQKWEQEQEKKAKKMYQNMFSSSSS